MTFKRTRLYVYQIISVLHDLIDRDGSWSKHLNWFHWTRLAGSVSVSPRRSSLPLSLMLELNARDRRNRGRGGGNRRENRIAKKWGRGPTANYRPLIDAASRSLRVYH